MPSKQSSAARRLHQFLNPGYADGGEVRAHKRGGPVRGPGTGTSDSIHTRVPSGTFVMPADSTKAIGEKNLASMGDVPVRLSDGEFKIPPEKVQSVGAQALMALLAGTHTPVGAKKSPKGYADGGQVRDPNERANSFGDAAAAAADPRVTQVASAPAQPAPQAAQLSQAQSPVSQIPTDGYAKAPPADGSQSNPLNSEVGRNITNTLAALPGLGGVGQVASTGGAISSGINAASRMLNAGAAVAAGGAVPVDAMAAQAADTAAPSTSRSNTPAVPSAATAPATAPTDTPAAELPGVSSNSDIKRDGNAYSATGPVSGDITINGQQPRNGGAISQQNMAAADALDARQRLESVNAVQGGGGQRSPVGMTVEQAQREGLVGAQAVGYNPAYDQRLTGARGNSSGPGSGPVEPGSFTGGFSGVIGGGSGNMRDRTPEQQRRDAEVQASSIHQPTAAGGRAALQSIRSMEQQALRNAGDLNVAQAHEEGAGARARLMEVGTNSRFAQTQGLSLQRLDMDKTTAGHQNRAAQRLEGLMSSYERAPAAQKEGIAEQIRVASGKDRAAHWKPIALQGSTDDKGNKTEGVLGAVNENTGEFRRMDAPKPQTAKAVPGEGSMVRGPDGRTYIVKNGRPVPMGS